MKSIIYILLNLDEFVIHSVRQTLLTTNLNIFIVYQNYSNFYDLIKLLDNYDETRITMVYIEDPRDHVYIDFIERKSIYKHNLCKFFYIKECMSLYNLQDAFYIDNNVMIYHDLSELNLLPEIYIVKDCAHRSNTSIIYGTYSKYSDLLAYITNELQHSLHLLNDYQILNDYPCKFFNHIPDKDELVFDGCAIGEYLSGLKKISYKINIHLDFTDISDNIESYYKLMKIDNPTIGHINKFFDISKYKCEKRYGLYYITSVTLQSNISQNPSRIYDISQNPSRIYDISQNPSRIYDISQNPSRIYDISQNPSRIYDNKIANLTISSEQLYQFSSSFDIRYKDIINCIRIMEQCDIVLLKTYYKNLEYLDNIILINDITQNSDSVKNIIPDEYVLQFCEKIKNLHSKNGVIKIFINSQIVPLLRDIILHPLFSCKHLQLYIHGEHRSFIDVSLAESDKVEHIYAKNIDIIHEKCSLLPLGLSNYQENTLLDLYEVMSKTYLLKKTNEIYINISTKTFGYRSDVIRECLEIGLHISKEKPFKEYLYDLAKYKYCLAIRGKGIDTFRFWECLYLRTIPILIDNEHTNMSIFIEYLKKIFPNKSDFEITFLVIKDISELPKILTTNYNFYIDQKFLKVSNYF